MKQRTTYTCHKYQVYNDRFHWRIILTTATGKNNIYHMDFSENITQMYKFKPQSSHFNKSQYSLHCTVEHQDNHHSYFYHLSDEMKHYFALTATIIDHILQISDQDFNRFKSDNAASQYKNKWLFYYY